MKSNKNFTKKVRSTGAQPSKMYGMAKIHKDPRKPPYRPILSMVGNFKSHLAIELDKLLKPFIPTEYTVKDTFQFIDKLNSVKFKSDNLSFASIDILVHQYPRRKNNSTHLPTFTDERNAIF